MKRDLSIVLLTLAIVFLIAVGYHATTESQSHVFLRPANQDAAAQPIPVQQPTPPPAPRTFEKVYSLLPGQTATISNTDFKKINMISRFPVQIVIGSCYSNYTVDWSCDSAPTDIFIKDQRMPPLFKTPEANFIRVSGSEF